MTSSHKKPGVAFWATVVMIVFVLCELSASPVEMLSMRIGDPDWLVVPGRIFYAPLAWLDNHSPEWWKRWDAAYDDWWQEIVFPEPSPTGPTRR